MPDFTILFVAMPAILFALTFHEYAHAWAAWKLGDPTARSMGRLSLNPLVHLDPAGTIMLIITVMSGFGIGWAKPPAIDPNPWAGHHHGGSPGESFPGPGVFAWAGHWPGWRMARPGS